MDYYLADNPLTPNPKDFRGVLLTKGTKNMDDVVKGVADDNVGISESELLAVFRAERKVISQFLAEGYTVNTELFSLSPSLRGVFEDIRETYNPEKHKLHLNFMPSKALREVMNRIALRKISQSPLPVLTVVEDVISQTTNQLITPGKVVRVFGDKLNFDPQDTEQGLFFINSLGQAVRSQEYIELSSKKIYAGVPDGLKTDSYNLQLTTKTKAGELRSGKLPAVLSVA